LAEKLLVSKQPQFAIGGIMHKNTVTPAIDARCAQSSFVSQYASNCW
jgi:hypothetical protein